MDFKDLVINRESCRNFSDQPIEKEKLEELIMMARLAPSAVNSQPWSMHVVYTKELVSKIAPALQAGLMNKFANKAQAFIVVCEEREPFLPRIISGIKELDFASIDIGILTAYLTLGATEIGLSSCIIGWFNSNNIIKTLNLPKKTKIRLVIALGYSNTKPKEKKRKDINLISKFY